MAVKIKSIFKVVAVFFCFGSIFFAQGEDGQMEMHKVEKKHMWDLGCLFKFNERSKIFLLNEEPFQLLYCEHLRTTSAIDTIGRVGQMLLTFKDNSLIIEGIELEKIDESTGSTQLNDLLQSWEKSEIQFRNMRGLNLFPALYWQTLPFYQGEFFTHIKVDEKYGGDVFINVEKPEKNSDKLIMNLKTAYDMVLPQAYPEMAKKIGGEIEYDTGFASSPPFLIATSDLDGDGAKELIIGQGWYKTKAIFIWSRTPKKFLRLDLIARIMQSFTDGENPEAKKNSGLFEKGKIIKISLK